MRAIGIILCILGALACLLDQTLAAKCKKYLSENSADETFGHTKERQEEHIMAIRRKEDPIIPRKRWLCPGLLQKVCKVFQVWKFHIHSIKEVLHSEQEGRGSLEWEVSKNSVKVCKKSGRYAGYISSAAAEVPLQGWHHHGPGQVQTLDCC
eukprot:jgi/Picre1/27287/NNA_000256.t1